MASMAVYLAAAPSVADQSAYIVTWAIITSVDCKLMFAAVAWVGRHPSDP